MRTFNAKHRFLVSLIFVMPVGGCMTPPEGSAISESFPAPYDKLASCAYQRLLGEGRVGITYADLKAERAAVIREAYQFTLVWQAKIESRGGQASFASVESVPTIRGRTFYADQVLAVLRQCAQ